MKIHAIQTGTLAIRARRPGGRAQGAGRRRKTIHHHEWTKRLPIYAFAIEHPEGVIVVDTGETSRTSDHDYFPRWDPFYRYRLRVWVSPGEEIGPQLQQLGIDASDVRWVVMTHLHGDHAGGLHHFPHNEILVSRAELAAASGIRGRRRGYLNNRFPRWFDPTIIDFSPEPLGSFPGSLCLTRSADVTIVPLQGHTPGHIGVLVEDGNHAVLIAGDSSLTEHLMLRGIVDATSRDHAVAQITHQRICEFAAKTPTVYLVAHDPETPIRLAERRTTAVPTDREAKSVPP